MGLVDAVLVDLDGVVRHFDVAHREELERAHGLAPGAILEAAFDVARVGDASDGSITKAAWLAAVGEAIGAPEAALAWGSSPAAVDTDVLAIVDELRADGLPVGILTNGTDEVAAELAALDLTDRFDHLFNSWEIGHTKPDRRVFAHCCAVLDLPPERVAFTDDSPAKLAGARELGMPVDPFVGADRLRAWLRSLGALRG
jgi:HAD superfamily hydrolase (TIGR01509 family)